MINETLTSKQAQDLYELILTADVSASEFKEGIKDPTDWLYSLFVDNRIGVYDFINACGILGVKPVFEIKEIK